MPTTPRCPARSTNLGTVNVTVTGNVYAHASPFVSGTTIALPDTIAGFNGTISTFGSLTVSNSVGYRANLKTTGPTTAGYVGITNVSGIAPGGSDTISAGAYLDGTQPVGAGALNQTFTLTYADDSSLNAPSGSLGSLTINVTGNVLGHSNPALSVASGNNQSVFLGTGGITASLSLTDSGTNLSPLDVNTLSSGLNGIAGTVVVASGGSSPYSATLNTGTAGLSQSQAFSLKAGDEQALSGASPLGTLTQSISGLSVYNHAAGALSGGTTLTIPSVIVGYGSAVSSNLLTVSNTAANPAGALLTTGSTSLSNVTLNNANNVAAGGTGSLSATLAIGLGVGAFTQSGVTLTYGDASTYTGASSNLGTATLTITGNVLDHAFSALSSSASNFGRVMQNSSVAVQTTLSNTQAAYRAGLQITSLSGSDSISGVTVGQVIANGGSQTLTIRVSTGTIGAYSSTDAIGLSDDQSIIGWSNLAAQTFNMQGDIVAKRLVTATSVDLGRFMAGQSASGASTLATTGGDDANTRVTVNGTLFNSATSTSTYNLNWPRAPIAPGAVSDAVSLPVTTAENGGLGLPGEGSYNRGDGRLHGQRPAAAPGHGLGDRTWGASWPARARRREHAGHHGRRRQHNPRDGQRHALQLGHEHQHLQSNWRPGPIAPGAVSDAVSLPVATAENGGLGLPGEGSYNPVTWATRATPCRTAWSRPRRSTWGASWPAKASAGPARWPPGRRRQQHPRDRQRHALQFGHQHQHVQSNWPRGPILPAP